MTTELKGINSMESVRQETGTSRYRDDVLEAKIDAAKGWINEPTSAAQRKAFQYMADLIAQRSPEYISELEYQKFGDYL